MRPIDADVILDGQELYSCEELADFVNLLRNAPTITQPPNDLLTLAELREMDGEPVWVVTGSTINAGRGHWDICDWWDKDTVMFPYSGEQPRIDECGITWLAYLRRPEEGMT